MRSYASSLDEQTVRSGQGSTAGCRWQRMPLLMFALLFLCWQLPAQAALNVLACEPEWAALTRELAGARALVSSATSALQDPHRIEARPALMAQARRADLLVCTGAELEAGWLPLLLRGTGNAAIQPGQPGYFEAAAFVSLLEKPAVLDRAQGDVHAAGNPHLHLDPGNLLRVAAALTQRLIQIDPAGATHYAARHADFSRRWQDAITRWEQQAVVLRGVPVVVQHRSWSYLVAWLGLVVVADLEPKPGIEPSAAHLAQVLERLRAQPARLVLRAGYLSPRAGDWLAARSGLPVLTLPFTVAASAGGQDLFAWYDDILQQLTAALR